MLVETFSSSLTQIRLVPLLIDGLFQVIAHSFGVIWSLGEVTKNVISRSSAEAELRVAALGTCEGLWLRMFVEELVLEVGLVKEFCDNNATISIIHNPVNHNRIKRVEIDRHFIKEKINSEILKVEHIPTSEQIVDIFTKVLFKPMFGKFVSKLGMYNLYNPA